MTNMTINYWNTKTPVELANEARQAQRAGDHKLAAYLKAQAKTLAQRARRI